MRHACHDFACPAHEFQVKGAASGMHRRRVDIMSKCRVLRNGAGRTRPWPARHQSWLRPKIPRYSADQFKPVAGDLSALERAQLGSRSTTLVYGVRATCVECAAGGDVER